MSTPSGTRCTRGYGLVQRSSGTERLALELTAAGRRLATGGPPAPAIPAAPGDVALVFDAELTTPDTADEGVRTADIPPPQYPALDG